MINISNLNLYKDNSSIFQKFIALTNQKEVLIDKVCNKIISNIKKEKLNLLDIGCADGFVTLTIIDKIKELYQLDITVVESSAELINQFQQKTDYKINFINENVELLENIPQSDFILLAHVISYINGLDKFLEKIIDSLNENALALIVVSNESSEDKKVLQSKIIKDDITDSIKNILSKKNIKYDIEVVESEINVSGVKDMSEDGRTIIEFFKHDKIENIPLNEVNNIKDAILSIAKNNKLKKLENYIWITK